MLEDLLGLLDSAESKLHSQRKTELRNDSDDTYIDDEVSNLESELDAVVKKESEVRRQLQRVLSTTEKEKSEIKAKLEKKLGIQRAKYEDALKRHQALLNGLVKEKEELTKQCEIMEQKVLVAREEAAKRDKRLMNEATTLAAQQRELAITEERERQKRILEQKTKEIKAAVVKGLEPEVQALIERQKQEIELLKIEHEAEKKKAREDADRRCEEARQRMIQQLERERKEEYQAITTQLQTQLNRERDLHNAELDRLNLKLKSVENDRIKAIESTKEENEELLEENRKRWNAELVAERLKAAKEIDLINMRVNNAKKLQTQKFEAFAAEAEKKIRQEMEIEARQRNERKLQAVVKKLEEETNTIRKRLQHDCEIRIHKAQSGARKRISEIEGMKVKLSEQLDILLASADDEKALCGKLDSQNKKLEAQIARHRDIKERIQAEISLKQKQIKEAKEYRAKREEENRQAAEEEKQSLREQLEEAQAAFREQRLVWEEERAAIEQKNKNELSAVSAKVKALLESKEEKIQALQDQLSAAQSKLKEVESVFRQRRRGI